MNILWREGGKLALGALFAFGLIYQGMHVYYNSTDSEPIGYYWTSAPQGLHRGDTILACLTPAALQFALAHHWPQVYDISSPCFHHIAPSAKTVFALPGDRVTVRADGIRVNGRLLADTRPLVHDHDGALLPRAPDSTVSDGYVFAGSTERFSYDSRYAGPLRPFAQLTLLLLDPLVHGRPTPALTRS